MNLDITKTQFWTNHREHILPAAVAIFVLIGVIGVVTSVAQYSVNYFQSVDARMWLVAAAFVGYMSLLMLVLKIMEVFITEERDKLLDN